MADMAEGSEGDMGITDRIMHHGTVDTIIIMIGDIQAREVTEVVGVTVGATHMEDGVVMPAADVAAKRDMVGRVDIVQMVEMEEATVAATNII